MPITYGTLEKAYIKRGLRILELEAERDALKAENEELRTQLDKRPTYEMYEAAIQAWKKEMGYREKLVDSIKRTRDECEHYHDLSGSYFLELQTLRHYEEQLRDAYAAAQKRIAELETVEWILDSRGLLDICPWCQRAKDLGGHAPDCVRKR